jgi:hypothetical protein
MENLISLDYSQIVWIWKIPATLVVFTQSQESKMESHSIQQISPQKINCTILKQLITGENK